MNSFKKGYLAGGIFGGIIAVIIVGNLEKITFHKTIENLFDKPCMNP